MNKFFAVGTAAAVLLVAALASAEPVPSVNAEKLPDGIKILRLEVLPAKIELTHPFDSRQLLLTAVTSTGERLDVTRLATLAADDQVVSISPRGLVRPRADGNGTLKCSLGEQSVSVPVKVAGLKAAHQLSYIREVGPVMSKLGCNQGTCHGSAKGKNGFKLSLRGYDPLFDHRALTDDLAGRRFNRAAPDQSLMLLKPSGGVPHEGGVLFHPGEPYYELLREWIAQGVKLDLDSPRVVGIEVLPRSPQIALPGMKQQMLVIATYSNGAVRDVTAEAFIDSSLSEVVEMDKQGLATAVRRGEASVLARYEGAYAATTVIVMGDRTGFVWKDVPENNHLDTLVYKKLRKVKVLPSELCSDTDFLRRVYLDLIGLPPEPEQIRAFVADPRETKVKRDALIDQLVGSPEYIEQWTNKWADLLQVNRKFLGEQGAWAMRNWIQQAVASNMPYDRFVNLILTASGSTLDNPPASYYKVLRAPGDTMENTTQLFLAVRFNCNKCHDHPFERWTQDQYYHLAAYFAQVGRKPAPAFADTKLGGTAVEQALASVEVVYDTKSGDVTHDRTGQVTPPEFPYKHRDLAATTAPRREQLAHWITSKDNPYFAKSYVNRIWSYLLGAGIIEPVDDIRAGNPPTNPELLDRLTQDFMDSDFNVQLLFRTICKSRVYQQTLETNRWNADDDINYSHALARRLPAETLYDAIHRVTGSINHLPGVPVGFRASQTADSTVKLADGFLELFGRPARESACECERSKGVMLGQALNLVNGPTIADAIQDPNNRITKLVAREKDDAKVVEELFVAILNRFPTKDETAAGVKALSAGASEPAQRLAAKQAYEKDVLPRKAAEWAKTSPGPIHWTVLETVSASSAKGAKLDKQADGAILVSGPLAAEDIYTIVGRTKLTGLTGLRIEALTDPSLPKNGPGRGGNGNFVLSQLKVDVASEKDPAKSVEVTLDNASADFSQSNFTPLKVIDGSRRSGWAIAPQIGANHVAVFQFKENAGAGGDSLVSVVLEQFFEKQPYLLGKFRLSVTSAARPVSLEARKLPEAIAKILAIEPAQWTAEQKAEIVRHYGTLDADYQRLVAAVTADQSQAGGARLQGAQDLAWALLNSPAFLFNR